MHMTTLKVVKPNSGPELKYTDEG